LVDRRVAGLCFGPDLCDQASAGEQRRYIESLGGEQTLIETRSIVMVSEPGRLAQILVDRSSCDAAPVLQGGPPRSKSLQ
jgi:hypothetical protein